ncbi:MAG: pyrroline-5-carboxylate reductase dimerization domain-containing protein [Bacillus sp. (in: firmicutes)]
MENAGIKEGFDEVTIRKIVAQMIIGAAKMVQQSILTALTKG